MTLVVHINGWPGCGKLTIARELSARLGGRLLDNHTLLNPAEALFERDEPQWQELRSAVREVVLEHATRVALATPLVLTDALEDADYDRVMFEDYRRLAMRRCARLVAVIIDCEIEENRRRLSAPGRAHLRKLTKPDVLEELRARHRLLRPDGAEIIDLDVTQMAAGDAAAALAKHVSG